MIFVSTHLPSTKVPEAGQKICYRHLLELSRKQKCHLISFVNEMERDFLDPNELTFCETVSFVEISNHRRLWNFAFNFLLPLEVAVRCDQRVLDTVELLLQQDTDKEIFLEYEQAAFILPRLKGKVKSTVVFHDVISQSIQRRVDASGKYSLKRLFHSFQLALTLAWERRLTNLVDKAIVLNEKDKALLVDIGFDPACIEVEYPIVAEQFYAASRDKYEPETILFWGAMNRMENEDAVKWFITDIYPKVKEAIPRLKFIVLGANPSDEILRFASDDIIVTGFVEDPIPYFELAAVAVAPLRYGAGVKLKVLEAIAAKLPVIGTSVAAEGVKAMPFELSVVDDESGFAKAIIDRVAKPEMLNVTQ